MASIVVSSKDHELREMSARRSLLQSLMMIGGMMSDSVGDDTGSNLCLNILYMRSEVCLNGSVHSSSLLFILVLLHSEPASVPAVFFSSSRSLVLFHRPQHAIMNICNRVRFVVGRNFDVGKITKFVQLVVKCVLNYCE